MIIKKYYSNKIKNKYIKINNLQLYNKILIYLNYNFKILNKIYKNKYKFKYNKQLKKS